MIAEGQRPLLWNRIFPQTVEFSLHRGSTFGTRAKTRQFFSHNLGLGYHMVVRRTQALGDRVRVARKKATTALAVGHNTITGFLRGGEALSVEISNVEGERDRGKETGDEVTALTDSYSPLRNRNTHLSSSLRSHQTTLLPTPETKKTVVNDFLTPSPASVYYKLPPTPGRPPRFWL